jgi:hypothetical protein
MQRRASFLPNSDVHFEDIYFSSANKTSNGSLDSLAYVSLLSPIVEKLIYYNGQLVVLCEKEIAYSKQTGAVVGR